MFGRTRSVPFFELRPGLAIPFHLLHPLLQLDDFGHDVKPGRTRSCDVWQLQAGEAEAAFAHVVVDGRYHVGRPAPKTKASAFRTMDERSRPRSGRRKRNRWSARLRNDFLQPRMNEPLRSHWEVVVVTHRLLHVVSTSFRAIHETLWRSRKVCPLFFFFFCPSRSRARSDPKWQGQGRGQC